MINTDNILKSSKRSGKYENIIISKLKSHFENIGYDAVPHARFNIAWGNIISDVDLLLLKNNKLTMIEVKSSRDKLQKAKNQINNVRDFVDFVYLATDYRPKKWSQKNTGMLLVNGSVDVIKEPKPLIQPPRHESIDALQKKCLKRLAQIKGHKNSDNLRKYELVNLIKNNNTDPLSKDEIKEVVTCGLKCDTDCPIWNFKSVSNKNLILLSSNSSNADKKKVKL